MARLQEVLTERVAQIRGARMQIGNSLSPAADVGSAPYLL